MGIAAQTLREHAGRLGRIAVAAVVLPIALWQSYSTVGFANFTRTHAVAIQPARPLLAAAELAKTTRRGGLNEDLIIVADGDNLPWEEAIVSTDAALSGVPHRFFNGRNTGTIFRPGGGHYLFLPGTGAAFERLRASMSQIQSTAQFSMFPSDVQHDAPADGIYLYVVTGPLDTGQFAPADAARWEHGLLLRGARWQRNPESATLRVLLEATQAPPAGANFHWFQQLYAAGAAITQIDGQGVHPFYWRPGDLIVHSFDMPIAASATLTPPVVMRVGSYAYPPNQTRAAVTLSYGKVTDNVDIVLVP